ncbi:MAG: glycosyltransferase [Tannerellaceae bacterium]
MTNTTIIIPFLNEKEELYNTVRNIRQTTNPSTNIILVNDNSNDNYNYKKIADTFCTRYIANTEQLGVAKSREIGISTCTTDNFILLDAHMRFYQKDWDISLTSSIDNSSIVCCQTKALHLNNGYLSDIPNRPKSYGAYIGFNYLTANWIPKDPDPSKHVIEIPCILGAAYACSKRYWNYIHGLKFLEGVGFDEQYISLKVKLSGGKVLLSKDIEAGHIYRQHAPYLIDQAAPVFNRIVISELLLPPSIKDKIFARSCKYTSLLHFKAIKKLQALEKDISKEKEYLQCINKVDITEVIYYNKSFSKETYNQNKTI